MVAKDFRHNSGAKKTHRKPSSSDIQVAIIVVKIMPMQTIWMGGKSVAKTTGKLIKGPRTNSGTPNHQLSKRKRKTKKRTAATRWSSLLALHFGTYPVATAFWRRRWKIAQTVLSTRIFPERRVEGRFLGAVSLSSMTSLAWLELSVENSCLKA